MRQWCIRPHPDRPWPSERFAGTELAGQRPVAARPFISGRTSTTHHLANDPEVIMPASLSTCGPAQDADAGRRRRPGLLALYLALSSDGC